ncbi:hypothetical protein [Natrarchaeobius oligotrophus]|uniref:Uncharacterized protein n=1 Tax=Natrarchaeobius chitinivorans TaxID=1679083 RepID=A0A3N6MX38_NATCH|nr:hypothetical protein [Natrarchaeobius chitinivorans]RQH00972.1 hypothetical protein EA472_10165 [Natrarchaeobius chitinivorans]
MYEKTIGRPERDPFDVLVDVLAAVDRYDFVLGVVPVAFAVALVASNVTGLSTTGAVLAASVVGALAIVDACYLNPPIDQDST